MYLISLDVRSQASRISSSYGINNWGIPAGDAGHAHQQLHGAPDRSIWRGVLSTRHSALPALHPSMDLVRIQGTAISNGHLFRNHGVHNYQSWFQHIFSSERKLPIPSLRSQLCKRRRCWAGHLAVPFSPPGSSQHLAGPGSSLAAAALWTHRCSWHLVGWWSHVVGLVGGESQWVTPHRHSWFQCPSQGSSSHHVAETTIPSTLSLTAPAS